MKRRGFLKMLGIGAAVPAMSQIPEQPAKSQFGAIAPATKIEGPDGAYIFAAAKPTKQRARTEPHSVMVTCSPSMIPATWDDYS